MIKAYFCRFTALRYGISLEETYRPYSLYVSYAIIFLTDFIKVFMLVAWLAK